ncbi:hypothetical protein SDC9_195399 [bioreactor metagenome]|uniref:Uncharacterized protein n=1 Tax=bioreactor metagenome TaxID=1076179 RepID=A0A645I8Y7_9ZZZZ
MRRIIRQNGGKEVAVVSRNIRISNLPDPLNNHGNERYQCADKRHSKEACTRCKTCKETGKVTNTERNEANKEAKERRNTK